MAHAYSLWIGIDWATEDHQICGVDAQGKRVFERSVEHSGTAIGAFVEELLAMANGEVGRIAVAIETPRGSIVEALLERGVAGFSINPKQLDRFRDRYSIGGAKSDKLDAFVLADSLRTDLRLYRRIEAGDPLLVELREMVHAHDALTKDGVALTSRLREQLHRYYPQLLELGNVHDDQWLLELWELAPTPANVKHLKRAKVEALLRRNRIRRLTVDQVLEALRATPLVVARGVVEGASAHAALLVPLVRTNRRQLADCDQRIKDLMSRVGRDAAPEANGNAGSDADGTPPIKKHRDADILLSVAGLGVVTSATMLAEASTALRNRDYQALRTLSGVAPVSSQTGKQRTPNVSMRRACNSRLRNAVRSWVRVSMQHDARTRQDYARLRAAGHSYERALRGVGDRLLKMLVVMLRTDSLYDASRRGVPVA